MHSGVKSTQVKERYLKYKYLAKTRKSKKYNFKLYSSIKKVEAPFFMIDIQNRKQKRNVVKCVVTHIYLVQQ